MSSSFAECVNALMRRKGLNATQLGQRLGYSQPGAVSSYLQGVRKPGEELIYRWADALECSPRELLPEQTPAQSAADEQARAATRLDEQTWQDVRSCAHAGDWAHALKLCARDVTALGYLQSIARARGELPKLQALQAVMELEVLEAKQQLHPGWDNQGERLEPVQRLELGGHHVELKLIGGNRYMTHATVYGKRGARRSELLAPAPTGKQHELDRQAHLQLAQQLLLRVIRGDHDEEEERLRRENWPLQMPYTKP